MTKLFISQPMKDKTNEQILEEREKAIAQFKDVEVIDSFLKEAPHDATPLWYLGESLKLLGEADIVYFCKGWEKYNGCTIEHECAVRYGKQIVYAN